MSKASYSIPFLLLALLFPVSVAQAAVQFSVESDADVATNVRTSLTVTARDSSGNPTGVPNTTCVRAETTSSSGSFFSSASDSATESDGSILVWMNKQSKTRTIDYRDGSSGTPTITFTIAVRPQSEERSCTNWPMNEWSDAAVVETTITVGDDVPVSKASTETSDSEESESTRIKRHLDGLEAGGNRTVTVGASEFFEAQAYDQNGGELMSVTYTWNFGDGRVYEGKKVLYAFNHPGSYVVSVTAVAPRDYRESDRFTVEAISAPLRVVESTKDHVAITNDSDREIDLSMWSVRSGEAAFQIPHDTIILPGSTLRFSHSVTGLAANGAVDVALLYPNGRIAHRYAQSRPSVETPTYAAMSPITSQQLPSDASGGNLAASQSQTQRAAGLTSVESDSATQSVGESSMLPWLLALIALLTASVGGLLFIRAQEAPQSDADRYTIIDESDDV